MMEQKRKSPKSKRAKSKKNSKKKLGERIPKGQRRTQLTQQQLLDLFEAYGTYRQVELHSGIPRSTLNAQVKSFGPEFVGRLQAISSENARLRVREAIERAAIEHRTERTRYEMKEGKWIPVELIVTKAPPHIEFVEALERQASERLIAARDPLLIVVEKDASN